jgi:hypothetical protein
VLDHVIQGAGLHFKQLCPVSPRTMLFPLLRNYIIYFPCSHVSRRAWRLSTLCEPRNARFIFATTRAPPVHNSYPSIPNPQPVHIVSCRIPLARRFVSDLGGFRLCTRNASHYMLFLVVQTSATMLGSCRMPFAVSRDMRHFVAGRATSYRSLPKVCFCYDGSTPQARRSSLREGRDLPNAAA